MPWVAVSLRVMRAAWSPHQPLEPGAWSPAKISRVAANAQTWNYKNRLLFFQPVSFEIFFKCILIVVIANSYENWGVALT